MEEIRTTIKEHLELDLLCLQLQELFHVYLNKFEFHFLRLHVNKINNFCFLLNYRRAPCMTK